jgi:hypothetical protein
VPVVALPLAAVRQGAEAQKLLAERVVQAAPQPPAVAVQVAQQVALAVPVAQRAVEVLQRVAFSAHSDLPVADPVVGLVRAVLAKRWLGIRSMAESL